MTRKLSSIGLTAAMLAAGVAPAVISQARDLSGVRAMTRDHQTFDSATFADAPINAVGDRRGKVLDHQYKTHDNRTIDSTGAFLVGELERLDQTLHLPLANVSWSRDIELREDVSLADEYSSYTLTTFASGGSLGSGQGGATGADRSGKAWIGKATNQIGGVGVDTQKITNPLTPWALELKFSVLELESAAKMGRPIDDQKLQALKLKMEMDTDEQVYVGDAALNVGGLLTSALVTNVSNVVNGASASPLWTSKTADEILRDLNDMIVSAWAASGYAQMPENILIPPTPYGYITSKVVSTAGSVSIMRYLLENNIVKTSTGKEISIKPCKWLAGAGVGGTLGTGGAGKDRMIAYTKRKDYVRFPKTAIQRTPIQFDSIYHKSTFYCRLGVTEVVYPETFAYRDGIS
jgi:hypothetical protein